MASAKDSPSREEIPLDEMQHFRGAAQEQSMNTLLSAQRRFENATTPPDSTRDSIYDAIEEAKKQIREKDKIPFGGEHKDVRGESADDSANAISEKTIGDTLSGYAKNVKEAAGGHPSE